MFGKRLRELRELNHFSMDKLVELYNEKYDAKMNKSTLSRYENGLQDPIYTVVVNLADFFDVSVDYISGGKDEKPAQPEQAPTDKNIIKLAGRDGTYIERELTDEQIELMKSMVKQLPDADDL